MRFLSAALLALFLPVCSSFADEIPPPFGFRWADTTARVEKVLKGAKAKTVGKEKNGGEEIWTVEGLIHPGLKRTLFTFKEGALTQIELQYEYPGWTLEHYNNRMGEIRRYFDGKYGTGRLISRSRDNDTDVIQTLVGYQWVVGKSALELFYFSAQKEPNVYRNITVTYKAL
ncbi:MAG: hypothetical protein H0W66_08005 [Chthoniobacterales bacterium]|nr:hypothetical protein [Chthoniobacterales bacterium]